MKTVKLSNICVKITDGSHYSPKASDGIGYPYVTVRDIKNDQIDFGSCKQIDNEQFQDLVNNGCRPRKGDLLFSKDGTVGKVSLVKSDKEFVVLSSLAIVTPDQERVLPEYLFHVLKSSYFLEQAIGKKSGTAIRRIILRDLKNIEFDIEEDLEEQRRIVARLDAAFEKIDRAIELTERNIKYSQSLFNSLIHKELSKATKQMRVGDVFVLQRGFDLPKATRNSGPYHLISSSGQIDLIDKHKVEGPGVCTGRSGSVGSTFYVANDFWPLNTTLYIKDFLGNDKRYCYWLLKSMDLKQLAGGTGVPTLNRNIVHEQVISVSESNLQKNIARRIDEAYKQSEELKSQYKLKLSHLRALKQSLLNQAFSESAVK